ncbi:flavodoxin family protein [uncultured Megasphaera sp.]|uniref:flavodoxin family protein n=1 Tax=Megasphaera massiliensis TaxID=1232428 RepID=UPI00266BEA91|nr:flavodoxin family protein [uncultured Megasphaera sp.]
MKITILMSSPRKNGNTKQCLDPFCDELKNLGHEYQIFWLYDYQIDPCYACRGCQQDWEHFACVRRDDLSPIADAVLESDLIVMATPIYSWYCPGPLKNVLDRFVYGFNKYYGDEVGPSLWAGKKVALMVTCGYKPIHGADLFEEGIKRYCKHSKLQYLSMFAERHLGYKTVFMDDKKAEHARQFAREITTNSET